MLINGYIYSMKNSFWKVTEHIFLIRREDKAYNAIGNSGNFYGIVKPDNQIVKIYNRDGLFRCTMNMEEFFKLIS